MRAAGPFEWELIRGHACADGTWLSDLSLRTQYVYLTDVLIEKITSESYDTVLYLDKSGRPVAWFVDLLWDTLARGYDGGEPGPCSPRPQRRFLNIDRLQWRDIIDPDDMGANDVERLPDELIEDLRRIFLRDPSDRDASGAALSDADTYLSGRRILVVDEVKVSGSTVEIAVRLLRRAFPESEVSGTQWMIPHLALGKDGNRRNNQLPVWYSHHDALGRGVADRDPDASALSPHWRVQAGRYFLSRPHPVGFVDVKAVQLRRELTELARLVCAREMVVVPSFDRDDLEDRCKYFNGYSLQELRAWREDNRIRLHPPS